MNRADIIRMAREMGCEIPSGPEGVEFFFYPQELERFAHLVYEATFRDANIAASRTILDAAVLQEREACANECEAFYSIEGIAQECAAAIRARSKHA